MCNYNHPRESGSKSVLGLFNLFSLSRALLIFSKVICEFINVSSFNSRVWNPSVVFIRETGVVWVADKQLLSDLASKKGLFVFIFHAVFSLHKL